MRELYAMARGDVFEAEGEQYRDEETGALVRRLTGDGSNNHHLYFTSTSFVGEGEGVVFASDRSGAWQLYMLETASGKIVQLTDRESAGGFAACLAPEGRLFYFEGPALKVLSVDVLDERELYRAPEGMVAALPTCTADGNYVAFAYREDLPVSTETGRIYSTMAERYYQRPTCVVMRVDTDSGEAVAAWGERAWISHVMIHPTRPELILFCHEGGSSVKQRMWTVDVSVRLRREAQPLFRQEHGENCCHEYFTRQGEVGFQCSVQSEGEDLSFNCFVRTDGTYLRQFLLPGPRPGHIQSNSDNTLIIGDRGYRSPEDAEGDKFMSLMTHTNGRAEVRRLCRHGTSWTQQIGHPHPIFSPDDRWALFSSDTGGKCNVYMVDVTSI